MDCPVSTPSQRQPHLRHLWSTQAKPRKRPHYQHQKLPGDMKTDSHPSTAQQTTIRTPTGVNQFQCTPTLPVQAAQPANRELRHPKANPGRPIQIKLITGPNTCR